MFYHRLTQEFETRPKGETRRLPRVLSTTGGLGRLLENPRAGGFAALGAVVLGAVLMVANVERGDTDAPVAEAQTEAPVAPTTPVARVAVAPSAPAAPSNAVAVAPATPVALAAPAPEKTTVRVDTTSTGAIAQDGPAKPKHKVHPKKPKPVDSDN